MDEVAKWLDDRKIPTKDLQPSELPGTTYGERFRGALDMGEPTGGLREADVLDELDRLRGTHDVRSFAELVFVLLHVALARDDAWPDLRAAGGQKLLEVLPLLTPQFEPLGDFRRSAYAISRDPRGTDRLTSLIRLVQRVQERGGTGVTEFLLEHLTSTMGRGDGTVHTPPELVRLLVEVLDPDEGAAVLDPCCGVGELLAGVARHRGSPDGGPYSRSFTGAALSPRTAKLASMNLRMHGAQAQVSAKSTEIIRSSAPAPGRRYDVVLTNPPFDMRFPPESEGLRGDYGSLPPNKTNFAWLQHAVSFLRDGGRAAVVMPGSTLFSSGVEQRIRGKMIDDGVVEAIVSLPSHLFASTAIPVTVWFLGKRPRRRAGEVLLVDAGGLGRMTSRTQRSLSAEEWARIGDAVRRWRVEDGYEDVAGFCASISHGNVLEQDYVLVPARYVGAAAAARVEPSRSVRELRDDLRRLEARAAEVDAVVEERLDRVRTWIR
ncbi:hypothetical protein GCM10010185_16110 [Saccharothrix coeruleofusca]|uniref:DNA methylase adenine-specific domain-containing protein n=1 Tax=Saccharothrix coeruleofusca TaxID=33919 RepID=A0A918EBV5_9PSEU|nr:hypothetical protein GCM10010185_16110 [Saccharothrix coeruleofusca]